MICWRNTPRPDTCGSYIHRLGYHPSFTKIKQCSGIVVKVGALLSTNINHQLTIVLWFEHRNTWFFPIAILRLWKPPGTKNTRNPSNPSSTQKNFGAKKTLGQKIHLLSQRKLVSPTNKNFVLFLTMVCFREAQKYQKTSLTCWHKPQLYLRKPFCLNQHKKSVPRKKKLTNVDVFLWESSPVFFSGASVGALGVV